MQVLIIIVLLLLIGATAAVLALDARQRRIDRHVAAALSAPQPERSLSIRRVEVESRRGFIHQLTDYRPGVPYRVRPAFVALAGAALAAGIVYANGYLGFPSIYVAGGAALAAFITVRGLFSWQNRQFATQLFRQLPDTIGMVTSAVRTGLPINEACRSVSREMPQPTAGQFVIVCNELALGKPPEEAIEGVYRRTGVREYGFFAVTLGVQMKTGGRLSETLQTLADTVRQRVQLAARAKALAAEVIFSARALSVAPLLVGALMYSMDPGSIDLLFTDPVGQKLLAYAVTSVILGTLVLRWMVRRGTSL